MSGTQGGADLTRVVTALQELTKASYLTQQTLAGGALASITLVTLTAIIAGLPTTLPASPGILWLSSGTLKLS